MFIAPRPLLWRGAFIWGAVVKKVALLIDGGHARVVIRNAGKPYNPDYIERFAHSCIIAHEDLTRILYYDCAPYSGTLKMPVSGQETEFNNPSNWLHELAAKDLFAVRLGVLKFRGFVPKRTPVSPATMTDADFKPTFEQKGVDMRIGLDIATYSDGRAFDRFVVVTADTDCIPAFKHARKSGAQVALIEMPGVRLAPELRSHVDFVRPISLP
jgi:uncharacterized LabA/DUF88 family protein